MNYTWEGVVSAIILSWQVLMHPILSENDGSDAQCHLEEHCLC